jgi:hypothetical protein
LLITLKNSLICRFRISNYLSLISAKPLQSGFYRLPFGFALTVFFTAERFPPNVRIFSDSSALPNFIPVSASGLPTFSHADDNSRADGLSFVVFLPTSFRIVAQQLTAMFTRRPQRSGFARVIRIFKEFGKLFAAALQPNHQPFARRL